VTPSNADDKSVYWKPAQGGYVVCDQEGNVTGTKEGQGTVTVHTNDGDYQSTARITVSVNPVASVEISDPNGIVLKVGETYDLTAKAIASDTSAEPSYPTLYWSSSSSSVASVNSGHVVALTAGETTITVRSVKYSSIYATCKVTVLGDGAGSGGSEGVGFDDWNFE